MIKIGFAGVWVHDQDEALAFYTEKLGWELRADVTLPELGGYRWLTVGPPGQADVSLLLNAIPGPPVLDAATAEQIRSVMAKGWAGNVLLTTDDAQASYEELTARGIEFAEAGCPLVGAGQDCKVVAFGVPLKKSWNVPGAPLGG